jgi:hypothetical protein
MQAHCRRYVDIGIRVMQRVKAPQKRHRVLAAMHEITQKVEQQEGRNKAGPSFGDGPRGQSDVQLSLELRPKGVRRPKDEGGKDQIKDPEPEIAEPPPQRPELAPPSRPAELPDPDEDQAAY